MHTLLKSCARFIAKTVFVFEVAPIFFTGVVYAVPSEVLNGEALVEAVQIRAQAERFNSDDVKQAGKNLYLAQLESDRAIAIHQKESLLARLEAEKRENKGRADDLNMRAELFKSQLTYNFFIFLLVVAVVACGLWFSYLQFTVDRNGMRINAKVIKEISSLPGDEAFRSSAMGLIEKTAQRSAHAFEVGSIKITSNVVGLIILTISLVFFYLYLDRVYTIRFEGYGLDKSVAEKKAVQIAAATSKVTAPADKEAGTK